MRRPRCTGVNVPSLSAPWPVGTPPLDWPRRTGSSGTRSPRGRSLRLCPSGTSPCGPRGSPGGNREAINKASLFRLLHQAVSAMGVSVSPVSSRISRPMLQLSANTDFYLNIKCNINIVINYIVGEATQSVLRLHIDVHKQSF